MSSKSLKALWLTVFTGWAACAAAQSAGDYRSVASGAWNAASTWERFDGTTWMAATQAPASADGLISVRSPHIVTANTTVTVDQVVVDAGGILVITAPFNLANGTGDDLVVQGLADFQNGSLGNSGSVLIESGGTLQLSTTNTKSINDPIVNNGTIAWQSGTVIPAISSGASLANNGTLTITGNDLWQDNSGTGAITNAGTITKTSAGTTTFNAIATSNSGTININAGTVLLQTGSFTNTGTINLTATGLSTGAGLAFSHNAGAVIQGAGTMTNGGILNLNIDLDFPASIPFTNTGTINGAGHLTVNTDFTLQGILQGAGTLTVNGNTTWNSGTLDRTFANQPGRTLTINTTNTKNLLAPLTNDGTMSWTGGTVIPLTAQGGALINNGTFTISSNDLWQDNSGTGSFTNTGTITKTSGGTTTFNAIAISNSGMVNINAGTLDLPTGSFTNTGTITLTAANLNTGSGLTFNHNTGSVIQGTGSFTNGGTLNLNIDLVFPAGIPFSSSGTVNGAGHLTVNNDFTLQGTLQGAGTLTVNGNTTWSSGTLDRTFTNQPGRTLTINTTNTKNLLAPLTNAGTMTWTGGTVIPNVASGGSMTNNGTFSINGNDLWQDNSGTGIITNTGTITKTSAGTTTFNAISTTNNGTININAGTLFLQSGSFTNAGTITLTAANVTTGTGMTFNHNTGSVIQGTGSFTNGGTLNLNIDLVFPAGIPFSSSGTVNGAGHLTVNNDFTLQGTLQGAGTLTVNGNTTWSSGTLDRTFTNQAGRTLMINTTTTKNLLAPLTNDGTMSWTGGTVIPLTAQGGALINNGTFTIGSNDLWQDNSGTGAIANAGTITKTSTGTTTFNAIQFTNNSTGILGGVGTLSMSTFSNSGTLAPGLSPGVLTMNKFSGNGTIDIEIAGIAGPGQSNGHDQLVLTSLPVALGGAIDVTLTNNYAPMPEDTFIIVTLPAGYTGTFASVTPCWELLHRPTHVAIRFNPSMITACPEDIELNNDPGLCSAIATYTVTASGDPAPVLNYTFTGATTGSGTGTGSGSAFNAGVTTVHVVAGNGCSGDTCTFTITVNDTQFPAITCPANITVNTDTGLCTASGVTLGSPVVTDNCPGAATANNAPAIFPIGNTSVTWTVTDAAGLTATCIQQVTAVDNQDPVVTCPANITQAADPGTCAKTVSYTATAADNCGVSTIAYSPPSGSVFNVGVTTVTVTATDVHGRTGTCSFTVTITDTEAPLITCPPDVTQSNAAGQCGANVILTATATDNCSSTLGYSPASGSFFSVGTTVVTATATDPSGNSASCTFSVTIEDTEAPVIACPPDTLIVVPFGSGGATVNYSVNGSDNCPGHAVTQIAGLPSGSMFPVDTTTNTFVITDAEGLTDTCSFDVIVIDIPLTCPADTIVSTAAALCGAVVNGIDPELNPPGTPVDYALTGATTGTGSGSASGLTFNAGVTTVEYSLTNMPTNACSFTVTVEDDTPPTITCPSNMTVSTDPMACGAVVNYTITADDNCPGETLQQTAGLPSGSLFPVGTTVNSFLLTDVAGNTAACTLAITVLDQQPPTIACPPSVTLNTDPGACTASGAGLGQPTTSDNCPIDTVYPNAPDNLPLGVTNVVWTVIDIHGNSATCQQWVTVVDAQAPAILCPVDIVAFSNPANDSAVVFFDDPVITDNCPGATLQQTAGLPSGSTFPIGGTVNTFVVTDAQGLTASCSFTVTVRVGKVGINTQQPKAILHVADSSVLFSGVFPLPGSPVPVSGPGTRWMWYSGKGAFRAGSVDGGQWDRDSIGQLSFAVGENVKAAGTASIALGKESHATDVNTITIGNNNVSAGIQAITIGTGNVASGSATTVIGQNSKASGQWSTAVGYGNNAGGAESMALGYSTTALGTGAVSTGRHTRARSFASFVTGQWNDTTSLSSLSFQLADPVFIIGNGTSTAARSNAFTILKNGNVGIRSVVAPFRLYVPGSSGGDGTFTEGVMIENTSNTAGEAALSFRTKSHPASRQWMSGINQAPDLAFGYGSAFTGANTYLDIDTTGRVGINTIDPQAPLHVVRNNPSGGAVHGNALALFESNFNSYLQFSSENADESGILSGNENTAIRSAVIFRADSAVHIRSGGNSTRINVRPDGSVGIGATTPAARLHVNGTTKLGANGTGLSEVIKATESFDLPSIAANTTYTQVVAIASAQTGSSVFVSPSDALPAGLILASARVESAGMVEIRFVNVSGVSVNPASMNYYFGIIK